MIKNKIRKTLQLTSVLILVGSFFFFTTNNSFALDPNNYNKAYNGTLSSVDWNRLPDDFLNKVGTSTLFGNFIVTSPFSVSADLFQGKIFADDVASGDFGANTFGGDYSFPGNLGIGKTSPQYTLDVLGHINFTGTLFHNGSPFMSSQWLNNGSKIYYNGGNVGIGTMGPGFKLDVAVSGDGDGVNIVNPTSNGTLESAGFQLKNNLGGQGSFFKLYSENTGVSALNNLLYVKNSVGGIGFLADTGSSIGFGIGTAVADASDLVISSTGNVGIASTSPKYKFVVDTSASQYSAYFNGLILSGLHPGESQLDALATVKYVNERVASSSGSGTGFWQDYGNDIANINIGNVGIGTTNPKAQLDVNSGVIALNGKPMIYLPNQGTFTGSLVYGTGGSGLVNSGGNAGGFNTLFGIGAGNSLTAGKWNTALGSDSAHDNTTGTGWVAVGFNTAKVNVDGHNWTAVGAYAGANNTSGSDWTALGRSAGYANIGGSGWTATGYRAGYSNTTGNYWTANGYYAGVSSVGGNNWTALGSFSGSNNTSGSDWTALGFSSGALNSSGINWTAVGAHAGYSNTGGSEWVALGYGAGYYETSSQWTALGFGAGYASINSDSWTAVGYLSGYYNRTTGHKWTTLGAQAGRFLHDGLTAARDFSSSLYLGANTRVSADGVYNENVIGYEAKGLGSNSVVLGNDSIVKTILKGNIGRGSTTPEYKLVVEGGEASFDDMVWGKTPGESQLLAFTTVEYVNDAINGVTPGVGLWSQNGTHIYNANIGNVSIGGTNPGPNKLSVEGGDLSVSGNIKGLGASHYLNGKLAVNNNGASASSLGVSGNASIGATYFNYNAPANGLIVQGRVGVGITNPSEALHVVGNTQIDGGLALAGDLTMSGHRLWVDKITANTIDPMYNIAGVQYSTFASAIVGGVKEEYVGRVDKNSFVKVGAHYEYVMDMEKYKEGSDLWVWYKTIDFNDDNVEIFLTPKGDLALMAADVRDKKIIIKSNKKVDAYMRLVGKRFDWRKWPTKSLDQDQPGGLFID